MPEYDDFQEISHCGGQVTFHVISDANGQLLYNMGFQNRGVVERYVRRLLEGGQLDVRGRPIKLNKDTVFYCFIVADIIGKMDEWTFSWDSTADGRGRLYQPKQGFKGSIELIGWDALLGDARNRNQAFFDRAGISGKSFFSDN